jgi:DNA-binding PadR family transcriptional regulator
MARKQLKNLTEPMYYILLSLLEPMHGYAIMQNIKHMTDGRVKVGPGTLYSLISRFEKEHIIKKVSTQESKKTYIATDKGKDILKEELTRLNQLVKDGNMLLVGEHGEE